MFCQDPIPKSYLWFRCRFFHTFHGLLMPLKNSGIHIGKTTASLSSFLASTKSAMSSLTRKRKLFNRFRQKAKESLHSSKNPTIKLSVMHWLSHKSNSFSSIIYVLMATAYNSYNWHLPGRLQMDAKAKKMNYFTRIPLSVFRERQAEESRLVKLRLTTNYAFLFCWEVGCPWNLNTIFHCYKNNLLKTSKWSRTK